MVLVVIISCVPLSKTHAKSRVPSDVSKNYSASNIVEPYSLTDAEIQKYNKFVVFDDVKYCFAIRPEAYISLDSEDVKIEI